MLKHALTPAPRPHGAGQEVPPAEPGGQDEGDGAHGGGEVQAAGIPCGGEERGPDPQVGGEEPRVHRELPGALRSRRSLGMVYLPPALIPLGVVSISH